MCSRSRDSPTDWRGPWRSKYFHEAHGEHYARADIHTVAHEGPPQWSKWVFPEETAAHGEIMQERVYREGMQPVGLTALKQGSSVRRKEQQRGAVID